MSRIDSFGDYSATFCASATYYGGGGVSGMEIWRVVNIVFPFEFCFKLKHQQALPGHNIV